MDGWKISNGGANPAGNGFPEGGAQDVQSSGMEGDGAGAVVDGSAVTGSPLVKSNGQSAGEVAIGSPDPIDNISPGN